MGEEGAAASRRHDGGSAAAAAAREAMASPVELVGLKPLAGSAPVAAHAPPLVAAHAPPLASDGGGGWRW